VLHVSAGVENTNHWWKNIDIFVVDQGLTTKFCRN